jgi:hypothetical protein
MLTWLLCHYRAGVQSLLSDARHSRAWASSNPSVFSTVPGGLTCTVSLWAQHGSHAPGLHTHAYHTGACLDMHAQTTYKGAHICTYTYTCHLHHTAQEPAFSAGTVKLTALESRHNYQANALQSSMREASLGRR